MARSPKRPEGLKQMGSARVLRSSIWLYWAGYLKRLQGRRAGADLIGQSRQAQINALSGVAFAVAVQRLMLAELLEQDNGRQVVRQSRAASHGTASAAV